MVSLLSTILHLTFLATALAHRARITDENTMVDNLYLDPTEDGEEVIQKFVKPFDPKITYGGILAVELGSSWQVWDGKMWLCAPNGTVRSEINPAFLKRIGITIGPEEDTRDVFRNKALSFAASSGTKEQTFHSPEEAIRIYDEQWERMQAHRQAHEAAQDDTGKRAEHGPAPQRRQEYYECGFPGACDIDDDCQRMFDNSFTPCFLCSGNDCYGIRGRVRDLYYCRGFSILNNCPIPS